MKRMLSLIFALCLALSLASCQKPQDKQGDTPQSQPPKDGTSQEAPQDSADTGTASQQPYTLTDDLGRQVSVTGHSRVAALLGSYADLWLLAGGSVCAAVDDAWDDFGLTLPDGTVNLGPLHKPSLEALLEARPELVFASSKLSGHRDLTDALEGAGIAVIYLDAPDFDSYLRVLKLMTDITGRSDLYETYGTAQKEKIEAILETHSGDEAQSVLVMRASAASIRAKNSEDTMLGGMLRDFGCVNIADSDSMLLDNLSVESIIEKNPYRIFIIQTGDDIGAVKSAVESMFSENPLWNELDAVKNGRVHYMEKRLYNQKPNARFAEAYQGLERILYEK